VLAQAAKKSQKVHIIDMKRSHNISIQLSGIKLPFEVIKKALLTLDDSVLGVSHLEVLLGAVPTPQEVEKLLEYKGELDNLGQVEQYFLEIIPIPRLEQRIKAFLFRQQFESNVRRVHADAAVLGNTADVLRENVNFKAVLKAVLQVRTRVSCGTHRHPNPSHANPNANLCAGWQLPEQRDFPRRCHGFQAGHPPHPSRHQGVGPQDLSAAVRGAGAAAEYESRQVPVRRAGEGERSGKAVGGGRAEGHR
jgi:hypothetical protein